MAHSLGGLVRQLATAARQAVEDAAARYAADRQPPPQPGLPRPTRRECTQYARPGPREDGLTHDQAALTAVQRRGLPCGIEDTALAEGLGIGRIGDACLVLKHFPDLAGAVAAGERSLFQAAYIARLRRDAPDLAARAETRMTGDRPKDTHMLTRLWVKAAARKAANGDRRYGQRDLTGRARP